MPAIRNSYNFVIPYDLDNEGIQLGSITYPGDVSEIAERYSNLEDVTYDYAHDVSGLRKAIKDGVFVIALFDMNQLEKGVPNPDSLKSKFGEHFVQITDIGNESGDSIWLKYWNWGLPNDTNVSTSVSNFNKAVKNFTILNLKK